MNQGSLEDFGKLYAAAWSSRDPQRLAAFFSKRGTLTVNSGPPSIGRSTIAATAREYMAAFPDMVVEMDSISREDSIVVFRWTWTGTNTGPGGTGNAIRISGYEELTMDSDGLIAAAKGHFEEAEYQRQLARS